VAILSRSGAPAGPDGAPAREWAVATLLELAPGYRGAVEDDTPLAEGGLCLDSIALITLVAAIEDRSGVALGEDQLCPEHFGTVARLVRLLESIGRRHR